MKLAELEVALSLETVNLVGVFVLAHLQRVAVALKHSLFVSRYSVAMLLNSASVSLDGTEVLLPPVTDLFEVLERLINILVPPLDVGKP